MATSPQIFSTSRRGLSAMTEKSPISHAYVFLFCFKAKITPLSISRLPRGSSNSFLWPSLLNFPLFNLLNKQISMDTAACYWYASGIPHIFAGEPRTGTPQWGCPTAAANFGRDWPQPGAMAEMALGPCFSRRCHTAIWHGFKHLALPWEPLAPCPFHTPQHRAAWPDPNLQIFLWVWFLCAKTKHHTVRLRWAHRVEWLC